MYSLICYYGLIADDKRWVKKMEPHLMVTLCRAVVAHYFTSRQQKNMDPILMGFLTGSAFTIYETFPGACRFGPQAELDWTEKPDKQRVVSASDSLYKSICKRPLRKLSFRGHRN
jgi:hypothetical protein